ncbi:glutamate receptor ionotropic, NMDA 2B-like isoform X2 [Branchiostoma lanceolatum]|uniref:glutamate receptor ionotropic, NMDA 2B-like isoform X2 n=1 Tax=Branchiostoma lanceolatum TaxID=7740 RepID=UPI003454EB2C
MAKGMFSSALGGQSKRRYFTLFVLLVFLCLSGKQVNGQDNGTLTAVPMTNITIGAIFSGPAMIPLFEDAVELLNARMSEERAAVHFRSIAVTLNDTSPVSLLSTLCSGVVRQGADVLLYAGRRGNGPDLSAAYIAMSANYLELPLVGIYDEGISAVSPKDLGVMMLNYGVSRRQECGAIVGFLHNYNWNNFAVVATRTHRSIAYVKAMQEYLGDLGPDSNFAMTPVYIDFGRSLFRTILDIKERVIVMFCSEREASRIFFYASRLGLTSNNYVWIIVLTTRRDLVDGSFAPRNFPVGLIALAYEHRWDDVLRVQFALDSLGSTVQHVISSGHVINTRDSATCWNTTEGHVESGRQILRSLRGRFFSQNGFVKLPTFHILNIGKDRKWNQVGTWHETRDVDLNVIVWPGERFNPPSGMSNPRSLRVVTIEEHPFVFVGEIDETMGKCLKGIQCEKKVGNDTLIKCCAGFCVDLLERLSRDVWFEYTLYLVEDNNFGAYQRGRWNGMVQDLIQGKAQLAMSSLKTTEERMTAVDFSVPFLETGYKLMVLKRPGSVSPTAFLEPFDWTFWLMMSIGFVVISALAVFFFDWIQIHGFSLQPNSKLRADQPDFTGTPFTFFDSVWVLWALLFNNSVPVFNPKGLTSKFMVCVWAFFATIFLASYTANLAVFMIQEQSHPPIRDLEDDLLQHPNLQSPPFTFGTVKSSSTEQYIAQRYSSMYQWMKRYNQPNAEAALAALKDGRLRGFIYDSAVLEYLEGRDEDCQVITVGKTFATTGYGVAFPKGKQAYWRNLINIKILQYAGQGVLQNLKASWFVGACKDKQNSELTSSKLTVENCASCFFLLIAAILFSCIVLGMEHIFFWKFRPLVRRHYKSHQGVQNVMQVISSRLHYALLTREDADDGDRPANCNCPGCEREVEETRKQLDIALSHVTNLERELRKKANSDAAEETQERQQLTDITSWLQNLKTQRVSRLPPNGGSQSSEQLTPEVQGLYVIPDSDSLAGSCNVLLEQHRDNAVPAEEPRSRSSVLPSD